MPISQTILPEFEHEMANTRKTLERVPDDKFNWKPHEKSSSLGTLATHLSNIPSWTKNTFEADELDVAPPGAFRAHLVPEPVYLTFQRPQPVLTVPVKPAGQPAAAEVHLLAAQ